MQSNENFWTDSIRNAVHKLSAIFVRLQQVIITQYIGYSSPMHVSHHVSMTQLVIAYRNQDIFLLIFSHVMHHACIVVS